jgi:hypothetical protein
MTMPTWLEVSTFATDVLGVLTDPITVIVLIMGCGALVGGLLTRSKR